MDLFDIDFHIFTVIKFLFNLGVRIKYIYSFLYIRLYIIDTQSIRSFVDNIPVPRLYENAILNATAKALNALSLRW